MSAEDDALKRGQSLSQLVSSPKIRWIRAADPAAGAMTLTARTVLDIGQVLSKIRKPTLVLTSEYGTGAPADGAINLAQYRAGVSINTQSWSFNAGWSQMTVVSLSPAVDWEYQPDDILCVSVTKTGGGIILPILFFDVSIEVP